MKRLTATRANKHVTGHAKGSHSIRFAHTIRRGGRGHSNDATQRSPAAQVTCPAGLHRSNFVVYAYLDPHLHWMQRCTFSLLEVRKNRGKTHPKTESWDAVHTCICTIPRRQKRQCHGDRILKPLSAVTYAAVFKCRTAVSPLSM